MAVSIKKIAAGLLIFAIGVPLVLILTGVTYVYVADRTNGKLVSSGESREYLLYIPKSYDPAKPAPLVISMHGTALWPAFQMKMSHWNAVADEHGFIVVYPSAMGRFLNKKWNLMPGTGLTKDVEFISDLIDKLEATYNIDPTRIYANGLSAGAGMAVMLGCRLSSRIAAIGPVATAHPPMNWCGDARPIPMIAFHGTADRLIPYNGGSSWAVDIRLESVPSWAANWARRNRCGPDPIESKAAKDVTRLEYTGCADDASVVLYPIHGGGHTWPGGSPFWKWMAGSTSQSIDATRLTWAFFSKHRLLRK